MKHRIIPSIICDFICGAFLPVVNQPSSKSICDSLQLANDTGEIEIQYQVAVPVTCRILPYVEVSKQGVEFILGSYIIVMLQHIQRQTFAETTRTDKEKITVGAFYQRDIHGLVHIIITIKAYIREIHHAVGQ